MTTNKASADKRRVTGKDAGWDKLALSLVLASLMAALLGVAGAFATALLVSIFIFDLGLLARAAGMLLKGVFVYGLAIAICAAVVVGAVAFVIKRSSVIIASSLAGGVALFGYALYSLFQAALLISPWGTYLGTALGAMAGIATGVAMAKSERASQKLRATSQKASKSPGLPPAEVEFWRADLGDGGGSPDLD